jgi:LysM repeat protein
MQRNPKAKTTMNKKPKLLANLIGEEKRRHHVAAFVTEEGEWNQHEPNTGLARMFIVMLVLHVFVIGGIILYDFVGEDVETQTNSISQQTQVASTSPGSVPTATPVPPSAPQNSEAPISLGAVNGSNESTANLNTAASSTPSLPVATAQTLPPIGNATPPALSVDHPELVALPETTDETPLSTSASVSEPTSAMKTEPEASLADVPPATTLNAKTETPVSKPETKVADAPPAPKPVPTPSEMAKRPTSNATPKTVAKTTSKTPAKPTAAANSRSGSYVMAKGDTLYRIAAKHGVSVEKIMKANGIKDAAKLRDGIKLVIPAK